MKERIILTAGLIAFFFFNSSPALTQNRPGLTVKETFDVYIQAIQNSDMKGLFTTVTEDDKFFFLTSGGRLIDSRQGYCKFHEDWFADKGMWNVLADVCTPIRRSFAEANPDIRYTPEQYILR